MSLRPVWVFAVATLLLAGCTGERVITSVEEYAEWCTTGEADIDPSIFDDAFLSNAEESVLITVSIDAMEAITPPDELAEFHEATLAMYRAHKAQLDSLPPDEARNPLLLLALYPLTEAVWEAQADLSPEAESVLIETGCTVSIPE